MLGVYYKIQNSLAKCQILQLGDKMKITDLSGRMLPYAVYDKFIVNPDRLECTNPVNINGNKEITLITCKMITNKDI